MKFPHYFFFHHNVKPPQQNICNEVICNVKMKLKCQKWTNKYIVFLLCPLCRVEVSISMIYLLSYSLNFIIPSSGFFFKNNVGLHSPNLNINWYIYSPSFSAMNKILLLQLLYTLKPLKPYPDAYPVESKIQLIAQKAQMYKMTTQLCLNPIW